MDWYTERVAKRIIYNLGKRASEKTVGIVRSKIVVDGEVDTFLRLKGLRVENHNHSS